MQNAFTDYTNSVEMLMRRFLLPWGSRYVPPEQARAVSTGQAPVSGSSASSTGSTPEVQPLKTLQLTKTPPRQVPAGFAPHVHRLPVGILEQDFQAREIGNLLNDLYLNPLHSAL